MNLKGIRTERSQVTVDVDPRDAFAELKRLIFSHHKIDLDAYVKDGKVFKDEEHHTSHSWTQTHELVNYTSEQYSIIDLTNKMEKLVEVTKRGL